jgi:hypothetical protein
MAYIHGRPGIHDTVTGRARHKDILLRIALPLLFLFILASAGLHAFQHGSYILTALFAAFFVFLLLRFEELGLTLAQRLSGGDAKARADRIVAKTLRLLPEGYQVFHGLDVGGAHIDHAVVGPNGFFLITTKTHLGRITESRDSLRLNGWPFLVDIIGQSWRQSQALLRRLDLQHSGAVQVCPVLCFSRGSVETGRLVRGVMIAQASTLSRMILEHESPLSSEKILLLTDSLAPLVRIKANVIEATHLDPHGDDGPAHARRPACGKCRHIPSDLEAELFPGECPRCGRLYSSGNDEDPSNAVPAALRSSAAPLAVAGLIVASGAALLAWQAGLVAPRPSDPAPASQPVDTEPAPVQESVQTEPAPPVPDPGGPAIAESAGALPDQGKDASPVLTQTSPEQEESGADASSNGPKAPAPQAQVDPGSDSANRTTAALQANATAQGQHADAACEPSAAMGAQQAQAARRSPAGLSAEGTLTIVSARPLTLWLTNDQTFKRFGPYRAKPRKALDIVLPKGCYSVVMLDNGRLRQTTVSFLSDSGRLDF